jgi:DNA-directed RNA polymerase alpha subunit
MTDNDLPIPAADLVGMTLLEAYNLGHSNAMVEVNERVQRAHQEGWTAALERMDSHLAEIPDRAPTYTETQAAEPDPATTEVVSPPKRRGYGIHAPIDRLGLKPATLKALGDAGITTIRELKTYSPNRLGKIPKFGAAKVSDVEHCLSKLGYTLASNRQSQ